LASKSLRWTSFSVGTYAPVRSSLRPCPACFTRSKTRKHLPADSQLLRLRARLKHNRDEATFELVVPELPLKSAAAAMPQILDVVGDAVATIERSLPDLPGDPLARLPDGALATQQSQFVDAVRDERRKERREHHQGDGPRGR
jgi:hypothetical protein